MFVGTNGFIFFLFFFFLFFFFSTPGVDIISYFRIFCYCLKTDWGHTGQP